MNIIVSGLDVHKDYTYATILGADGEKLAQRKMPNEEVPDFLKPYGVERVAMDATTSIAPLYRRLKQEGYDLLVSHPKKTRYIAEARIKTDKVDSMALAELLRLNSLPLSYMTPPDIAVLREKVRRRSFLVGQQTKLKIKIRSTPPTRESNLLWSTGCSPGREGNGSRVSAWSRWTAICG